MIQNDGKKSEQVVRSPNYLTLTTFSKLNIIGDIWVSVDGLKDEYRGNIKGLGAWVRQHRIGTCRLREMYAIVHESGGGAWDWDEYYGNSSTSELVFKFAPNIFR